MLSSYLRLGIPSGLFPLRLPYQNPVLAPPLPPPQYQIPRPTHSSLPDHSKNIW